MHVCVYGDDELGGGDILPAPGIDLILSYHPAKEEIQSFASTAFGGHGDQGVKSAVGETSQLTCKCTKSRQDGGVVSMQMGGEAAVQGAVSTDELFGPEKQGYQFLTGTEAVLEIGKAVLKPLSGGFQDEIAGGTAHPVEDMGNALEDLGDPSIRQGGGDQSHNLAIT